MKQNTETISDDNGIELIVTYEYEPNDPYQDETGETDTLVKDTTTTNITSVEVVIAGIGISITDNLTKKQIKHLINKLQYE